MDNKVIRRKISKLELAYIAGLFDGEGHVFITKDKRPRYKTAIHILRTGITNTHRKTIEWLFSLFPTTFSKRIRYANHPTWKPCFFWEASSKNALYFLEIICPYLKIKKEQVRLGIEFQKNWQDRRNRNKDARGRVTKTSDDVFEKREWYRNEITQLNKQKSPAET